MKTCSITDELETVYLERICIAEQILYRLLYYGYYKIESGTLTKYSITEKNSAIAADGKNYQTMF
jgi:hypothetical protein